jgi:hypothetical protein
MLKTASARVVFVGALLALSAAAQAGSAGTSSAQFLKLGAGARASAMGDAFAATADDVSALYWNPAGLAQIKDTEISAMQNNGLVDTQYQFAGAARPMGEGAIGLSLYRLDYGSINGYSASDTPQGSFSAGSLAGGLTVARKFGENIMLGATAKMVQEKIDGLSASTFAGDLGFLWRDDRFSVGIVAQHLGGTLKFEKESEDLPATLRADAAMRVSPRLLVAAGVAKARDNDAEVHAGGEISLSRMFQLRAGYSVVPGNSIDAGGLSGVTGGAGINLGRFSIDYGIRPFGDLGLSHRISITARFSPR